MTVLPLQERACVLRQAVKALQPHLLAGRLLQGDETSCCWSLIPFWGGMRVWESQRDRTL